MKTSTIAPLLAFILTACGGGGGGGGTTPPVTPTPTPTEPTENTAPSANAGSDQNAHEGNRVILDGSSSSDPQGDSLSYTWTQVSGPAVTLSNAASAQPQFTAPMLSDPSTTLEFGLVVNDGNLDSDEDFVSVTISVPTSVEFDPLNEDSGIFPLPNNYLFEGSTDRRLNIPGGDFIQTLNVNDGWSTINPMHIDFDQAIDPSSLSGGTNVRVFEVTIDSDSREVLTYEGELTAGVDYVVEMSALPVTIDSSELAHQRILIKPLRPLKPSTGTGDAAGYIVIATNGIRDIFGLPIQSSEPYRAVSGSDSLVGTAREGLENLRQQTTNWLQLLDAEMITPVLDTDDIIVSFSFTTTSTTDSLDAIVNIATSQTWSADSDPDSQSNSIVDVYTGNFTFPYYLDPTEKYWLGSDGKRVTRYDPIPVQAAVINLPFHAALPVDPACGAEPANGWPTTIYIGSRNSPSLALIANFGKEATTDTNLTSIADDLGKKCRASISISHFVPRSGLTGAQTANYWRQQASNLIYLVKTLPNIDLNDGSPNDFDTSNLSYIGHSAGADLGILLTAVEPQIKTAVISAPGPGIAKSIDGSLLRGPSFEDTLEAESQPGSDTFELVLRVIQANNDQIDTLNYIGKIRPDQALHIIEVYGGGILPDDIGTGAGSGCQDNMGNFINPGDITIPPTTLNENCHIGQVVETSYLAGVESIANVMGLTHAGSSLDNRAGGGP